MITKLEFPRSTILEQIFSVFINFSEKKTFHFSIVQMGDAQKHWGRSEINKARKRIRDVGVHCRVFCNFYNELRKNKHNKNITAFQLFRVKFSTQMLYLCYIFLIKIMGFVN